MLPGLSTKLCMEKDHITYKQAFVKALWKLFPNAASQWPNGSGFYTLLCLIAFRVTVQYKNLIKRMEKIGCVSAIKKGYI